MQKMDWPVGECDGIAHNYWTAAFVKQRAAEMHSSPSAGHTSVCELSWSTQSYYDRFGNDTDVYRNARRCHLLVSNHIVRVHLTCSDTRPLSQGGQRQWCALMVAQESVSDSLTQSVRFSTLITMLLFHRCILSTYLIYVHHNGYTEKQYQSEDDLTVWFRCNSVAMMKHHFPYRIYLASNSSCITHSDAVGEVTCKWSLLVASKQDDSQLPQHWNTQRSA